MLGLWVRRRPMNRRLRTGLSMLAFPLIRLLQATDRPEPIFTDQQMLTGIAGVAIKPAGN